MAVASERNIALPLFSHRGRGGSASHPWPTDEVRLELLRSTLMSEIGRPKLARRRAGNHRWFGAKTIATPPSAQRNVPMSFGEHCRYLTPLAGSIGVRAGCPRNLVRQDGCAGRDSKMACSVKVVAEEVILLILLGSRKGLLARLRHSEETPVHFPSVRTGQVHPNSGRAVSKPSLGLRRFPQSRSLRSYKNPPRGFLAQRKEICEIDKKHRDSSTSLGLSLTSLRCSVKSRDQRILNQGPILGRTRASRIRSPLGE